MNIQEIQANDYGISEKYLMIIPESLALSYKLTSL